MATSLDRLSVSYKEEDLLFSTWLDSSKLQPRISATKVGGSNPQKGICFHNDIHDISATARSRMMGNSSNESARRALQDEKGSTRLGLRTHMPPRQFNGLKGVIVSEQELSQSIKRFGYAWMML